MFCTCKLWVMNFNIRLRSCQILLCISTSEPVNCEFHNSLNICLVRLSPCEKLCSRKIQLKLKHSASCEASQVPIEMNIQPHPPLPGGSSYFVFKMTSLKSESEFFYFNTFYSDSYNGISDFQTFWWKG